MHQGVYSSVESRPASYIEQQQEDPVLYLFLEKCRYFLPGRIGCKLYKHKKLLDTTNRKTGKPNDCKKIVYWWMKGALGWTASAG